MVNKIYELKNKFIARVEHDISERGIDRIDVKEMGELVDMVKDLAEAEDYCWQAEYYKSISKAMENESSGYGMRSGYGDANMRSGYGSYGYGMPAGHHDVISPIKDIMQSATPEERDRLKNEIRSIIEGR